MHFGELLFLLSVLVMASGPAVALLFAIEGTLRCLTTRPGTKEQALLDRDAGGYAGSTRTIEPRSG